MEVESRLVFGLTHTEFTRLLVVETGGKSAVVACIVKVGGVLVFKRQPQ